MTEERRAGLTASGHRLSVDFPPEQREAYVQDYVEILGALNDRLDGILDRLRTDASVMVSAFVPFQPGAVKAAVDQHLSEVKTMMHTFVQIFGSVGDSAVRALLVAAIRQGLTAAYISTNELAQRNEKRNNEVPV